MLFHEGALWIEIFGMDFNIIQGYVFIHGFLWFKHDCRERKYSEKRYMTGLGAWITSTLR